MNKQMAYGYQGNQQVAPTVESLLIQAIQLLQAQQLPSATTQSAQAPETTEQETMDVTETASYLRMSPWTVRDMVRTKSIPHYRIRSRIFFRKRELEKWVAENMSRVGM